MERMALAVCEVMQGSDRKTLFREEGIVRRPQSLGGGIWRFLRCRKKGRECLDNCKSRFLWDCGKGVRPEVWRCWTIHHPRGSFLRNQCIPGLPSCALKPPSKAENAKAQELCMVFAKPEMILRGELEFGQLDSQCFVPIYVRRGSKRREGSVQPLKKGGPGSQRRGKEAPNHVKTGT